MLEKFQQTGPARAEAQEEGQDRDTIWMTRPGRVNDPDTGREREARQSFIVGHLHRAESGRWEPGNRLRECLRTAGITPPREGWQDSHQVLQDLNRELQEAWERSQKENPEVETQ